MIPTFRPRNSCIVAGTLWSPIQQQMHDKINCKKESYRLSSTCGALAITPTFRPWTHTSDDSWIYQLSRVVTTATVLYLLYFIPTILCTGYSEFLIYTSYFITIMSTGYSEFLSDIDTLERLIFVSYVYVYHKSLSHHISFHVWFAVMFTKNIGR